MKRSSSFPNCFTCRTSRQGVEETYLDKHNSEDKESGIPTGDRVHLNDKGNRFVADTILKCLGAQ